MANTSQTIFQRLGTIFSGRNSVSPIMTKLPPTFDSVASNQVLYSTKDRNDYERKLNQYKQQKLLSYQWVKAGIDNSIKSLEGLTAVKLMYRDADLMDGMPEIGAALDILSEEACLVGETKIKLLNGKTETIENLYKNKCANFWVYSVDESGICRPSCVEKVIYKGEKEVIKITLDDGTIVRCTPDHKLMLSDCSWKEAKDLAFGDSLMSIYDDINYLGYEQIKSTVENKKRLTHRVVAENVLRDEKLKLSSTNVPYQKIVIHHNTFNKLNNEPSALTYMYWNDHQKLHNDLNHKRWENTEFSEKMSKIFSETAKKTWAEKGDIIKEKMSYNWERFKKSDRYEEWKKQVNRSGAENGMYDIHRYGDLNPNYNRNANHFNDINEDEYVEFIISQKSIKRENLQKKFNLTKKGVCDYNKYICEKYGVDSICQIKYAHDNGCSFNLIFNEIEKNPYIKIEELCNKIGYSKHQIRKVLKERGTSLSKLESTFKNPWGNILKEEYISFIGTLNQKEKINDILSEKFNISKKKVCRLNSLLLKEFGIKSINSLKYLTCDNYDFNKIKSLVMNSASLSDVLNELNISKHEFSNIVKRNGYKDYRDLKKNLYNHRVTSVEIENSKEKVYDLLNSSTNNCFGIKCNNGQIISHNCAMKSNGKMLNVYSKSKRVKAILEDLFVNRLHIHTDLPMIARATLKYGNQFMLLNIDEENGILGWKQLPVYEIDRVENGYTTSPSAGAIPINASDIRPDKTRFIWVGHNESTPYEDWQMAHFRLLKDSFFLPYGCIVGDTRIETENGYKEIDSISIGDRIWTFDVNKQEKVLATVSMGMFKGIKDVYSVKTRHNFIEGTSDHKLLCYEDNQLKYKEIKDIKVGDLLVIDNSNNKSNVSIKIDKSPLTEMEANLKKSIQWWTNYINYIPDYVDEEFANFLGFMCGDGWLDGNRVCFATGEYDSFNKKYVDYLEKITNKKAYFRKNEHKINYDIQQALVTSKCLATILRRMGFSGKFNEKRVPEWLYSCNDKIKKAFLDGLMTADGSYNIDKFNVLRCSIELSNEQLIKDIKTLVQSLGYKSGQISSRNRCNKVRKPLSNGHTIKTKSTSYYFYYFESQNKQEKKYDVVNRKNDGFKTEKVLSNEYVGKKKTYDITVDNSNSNFFANGIVTHNCSHLHKARRAWRMWSMMEDAMLIYRLDKSIERRVFKIYVGSIDDQDVPAFIQQVADNFKRTPVIDPLTGQIDLRKNFLDVSSDYFIPVRDPSAPTPIENLASAQNPTSMDDINYMQNKVFSALRVPKQFLNFQEAQGKGQNLSLLDVRFARMVNTLQQFLLLELNKIAMIHLHLLGLDDDIMNFTLSLNNPSAQIEALELEDLTKRVNTATQALADPGIGMPLMSLHMVLKKIMKFSDSEIKDMLNEIRLEKAMAAELANTAAIIKKTGMFDAVDNIYGDYDVMNDPNASAQQPGMGNENGMGMGMGGGGAIGGGGGGFDGGALTFDSLEGGGDMGGSMGDINGTEATTDMSNAPNLDAGKPNESKDKNKPLLNEARSKFFNSAKSFTQRYFDLLSELERRDNGNEEELTNIEGKVTTINEQISNLFNKIDAILEENSNPDFSETVEDNDDETISSPSTSITESDLDNELLSNE